MSDFIDILTHGRRLQGAVKELSIEELESVQEKLANIVNKRKEKALEEERAEIKTFTSPTDGFGKIATLVRGSTFCFIKSASSPISISSR